MTVADLITRLSELPPDHPVAPVIDGVMGVCLEVWQYTDHDGPMVLIGEPITNPDAVPWTVPAEWSATIEGGRR